MENKRSIEKVRLAIKSLAKDGNKTIEGIIYFDEEDGYCFTRGVFSSVMQITALRYGTRVQYYKCTPSGNLAIQDC